jgi:hypothetical protein
MEINKTRQVEPLKDIDENVYQTALKQKNIDEYENELALVEGTLNIPTEIISLPLKAQYVLAFYCDRDFINKVTGKKTYNNILESYIASLEDDSFLKDVFDQIPVYDKDGNEKGYTTIVNSDKKHIYMKLKQQAYSYWNSNNLLPMVDIFKTLQSGGRKAVDELKEAITDDALYHPDENIRLKNRSLAVKVHGMDKNIQNEGMDVWIKSGGREFGKALAEFTGHKFHDITSYVDGDKDE